MAYVAGYVVKKMTAVHDPRLIGEQIPEFSRMSLGRRQGEGIGGPAIPLLAAAYKDPIARVALFGAAEDVTSIICIGGRMWPLGRYITQLLRKEVGYFDESASRWTIQGGKVVQRPAWKVSTTQGLKKRFEEMQRVRAEYAARAGSEKDGMRLMADEAVMKSLAVEYRQSKFRRLL